MGEVSDIGQDIVDHSTHETENDQSVYDQVALINICENQECYGSKLT